LIRSRNQHWSRLAAVAALVAAFGLSGCGRKGPLDPPPAAAVPVQEQVPGAPAPEVVQPIGGSQATIGRDSGSPAAPPPSGQRQPFFLDWLLN